MPAISEALFKWYDANARDLPWRIGPGARKRGERPDPYRVWLSEVMLQQTTVATVRPRFKAFLTRWPSVAALAAAPLDDVLGEWAGLGYYARARNLHKCAKAVTALGGFPDTEEGLRALPGVGDYTAAAVAAIAYDQRAVVMDGNIERVAARLFAVETPLPKAKPELKAAIGSVWPAKRSGDFAQALMDLGATICAPRAPKCLLCPLADYCEARAKSVAERLPVKAKKTDKPTRYGVVYALMNEKGEVLFERRPEKGLLGGMLGLPGTEWSSDPSPPLRGEIETRSANCEKGAALASSGANAVGIGARHPKLSSNVSPAPGREGEDPLPQIWRSAGTVTHTFTHFHLKLEVMTANAPERFAAGDRLWLAPEDARLPTVMKKAVSAVLVVRDG